MNITQRIIIALSVFILLILAGCGNSDKSNGNEQQKEPDFISDQYGFKIFDLDGYTVDTNEIVLARNILTLKKGDARVRVGFFKGAKMKLGQFSTEELPEKQILYEWMINSLQIPQFFPGASKILLKWEYRQISDRESIISDVLLEGPISADSQDETKIVKMRKSDSELFKSHRRILLRSYVFYRGDDLFSMEFLADPLTYQVEIRNFEKTIIASFALTEKSS